MTKGTAKVQKKCRSCESTKKGSIFKPHMQCILTFSIQGFFYFLSKIADSNLEMKNHQKAKLFFTYVHMKYMTIDEKRVRL